MMVSISDLKSDTETGVSNKGRNVSRVVEVAGNFSRGRVVFQYEKTITSFCNYSFCSQRQSASMQSLKLVATALFVRIKRRSGGRCLSSS
jgi:hypothetical protein